MENKEDDKIDNESLFSALKSKGKILVFRLMHEMAEHEAVGIKTYIILQVIQGLQILLFTFHETFYWTWNKDPVFRVFRTVVKYFQVDVFLRQGGKMLIIALNFTFCGINIILIAMIIFLLKRMMTKKPLMGAEIIAVQGISVYMTLVTTILVVPMFEVYMLSAYCNYDLVFNKSAACYRGANLGNFVVSLFNMLTQLLLMASFVYYYKEFNPLAYSPFASADTMLKLISIIRLMIYPVYVAFDFGNNLSKQFIAAQAVLQLLMLYLRLALASYYVRLLSAIWAGIEAYLLIFSIGGVIEAYLDTGEDQDLTGFVFCLILGPIASVTAVFIHHMRLEAKLRTNIETLKNPEEWLAYLTTVIPLINHKKPGEQSVLLEGLLRSLKENYKPAPGQAELVTDSLILQGEYDDERRAVRAKLWAEFMKELMKICLRKSKKAPVLHVIAGYIFYKKLNNKYRALLELSKALSSDPDLGVHFAIYRLSKNIEIDLHNEDEKLAEERGVDYNALVYFNDAFAVFQRLIAKACRYHRKLFEEIEEKAPDVFRVYKYGHRLIKEKLVIRRKFEELCNISPNHTRSLKLYSKFLDLVLNDGESAVALQERTLQIANKQLDNLKGTSELVKEKYEVNSETAIVVTAGDIAKLGIILSVNSLVEDLYGMKDKDLVGHNVIKLVPDVLKDDHQDYFKDFFEREEEARPLLTAERVVYAKNHKNFVVPSSIMLKSMPEIAGFAKIVAFLTPLAKLSRKDEDDSSVGILIQNEHGGILHGVTEQCEHLYGIMRSKVFGKKNDEFRLEKILPDLFKDGAYPFEDGKEVQTKLDTSSLKKMGDDDDNEQSLDLDAEDLIDVLDKVSHVEDEDSKDKIFKVYDVRIKPKLFVPNRDIWFLMISSEKEDVEPVISEYQDDRENREVTREDINEPQHISKADNSEDKRRLQEYYTSIKEKGFPKKIKSMIRLYVGSIFAILVMAVVAFYYNFNVKGASDEAMTVFTLTAQRSTLIPQIILHCQTIKILVDGLYSGLPNLGSIESEARNMISTLVNELQHVNVDAVNYQIKMDAAKGSDSKNKKYNVVLLLSNNQTSTFSKDFNDALLQFVTSASLIQNETLNDWKLDLINSPMRDYYYVEHNGLKVLRAASEDVTSLFETYYSEKVKSFGVWLYIQLSLIIFILIVAIATSLWTHIRLLAIYKLVAVFLGHLTNADIKDMRAKVDAFEATELANVEDADSEDFDNQANANTANIDAIDDDERREKEIAKDNKARYDHPNAHLQELDNDNENALLILKHEEELRASIPQFESPNQGIIMDEEEEREVDREKMIETQTQMKEKEELEKAHKQANKKNIAAMKREEAVRAIQQQDKIELLTRKKTIYYKIPYVSIVCNGLLLVSLFAVTLWQSFSYMNQTNSVLPLHRALGQRVPNIQYLVDLARDTIVNGVYKTYDNTTLFNKYMTDVEDLDDRIAGYLKNGLPSHFDTFARVYETFSLQNLCDGYTNYSGASLVADDNCLVDGNPILTKGESVSVISTINYAREIVLAYLREQSSATSEADITKAKQTHLSSENIKVLIDLSHALNKSVSFEIEKFTEGWTSLNSTFITVSIPLFVGLIIYLVLTLIYYLLRTLSKFRRNIMYNKGILRLVRHTIVQHNRDLLAFAVSDEVKEALE